MIEAHEFTRRYGDTTVVDSLSFTIAPGTVTGFLGPNGAGKSTTMLMIMGLDRPTSGTVTVNGKPYRWESPNPTSGSCRSKSARKAAPKWSVWSPLSSVVKPDGTWGRLTIGRLRRD